MIGRRFALLVAIVLCAGCDQQVAPVQDLRVIIRCDQQLSFGIQKADGLNVGRSGEALVLPGVAAQVRDRFFFDPTASRHFTVDVTADDHTVFSHPDHGPLEFTRLVPHPDRPSEQVLTKVKARLLTAQIIEVRHEVIYTVRLSPPPLPTDAGSRPRSNR